MQYVVRALDASQQLHTLVLEALDEADAESQARANQWVPVSVAQRREVGWGRVPRFSLFLFAQELHALLGAGLSVVEALETLIDKTGQQHQRAVMQRLVQNLRDGERLSVAMARQPAIFPPLFVGVIQAAEGTSNLPRALERYLDYEGRLTALRHRIVSAAIYPAILLLVGGGVCLFLLGYVVPRFAAVYQGSARTLPTASQLLMLWGAFVAEHQGILALGLVVVLGVFGWQLRRRFAAAGWWRLFSVLPGASAKLQVLELARLYLTLGMLLEGGIPLHRALRLCMVVLDESGRERLDAARLQVEGGDSLSRSLEAHGLSTPVALRLLRVGEQSGQLGVMLGRTAAFHDQEIARWIEQFSKAFEPVLMAAIGVVIGLIVVLLYMPIFEIAGSLP
jgi:general secretion pathway protein F